MTEHVQLEIIAAIVIIAGQALTIWRAEVAARQAKSANEVALQGVHQANKIAVEAAQTRKEQSKAIEQVHESVNGGMAAAKAEIVSLKAQLVTALDPVQRHEEIRGQGS